MLKGFRNFLLKELKELTRDPKILLGMVIVPLVLFPVLGGVMSYAVQSVEESAAKANLVVINNDREEWSYAFIKFLSSSGTKVFIEENVDLNEDNILKLLSKYNVTQVLEIPKGFSANITMYTKDPNVKAFVKFYTYITTTNIFDATKSTTIDAIVTQFNRALAPDILNVKKSTIIKGEIKHDVDPAIVSGLMMSQSIVLPIAIIILLLYSVQIAATSVAIEKEEKTLETLLTLPIDRLTILFGKLTGSIIIAAVGATAYIIGYAYFMQSLISRTSPNFIIDLASLGLAPSFLGYVLLGLSLFVAVLSALALAVILSAFAGDVRSAQSLVGSIYFIIFLPTFVLMYIDINTLPYGIRLILYAIPFSHPMIVSRAVMMEDYMTPVFSIIYVFLFTLALMYVASRLFATEKVLTAKLKFKWLKKYDKTAGEF
ncbi:MAG: ABC transporter permease [Nitrososphaerota archaeon]|nr:ABC transporter permease [Aigarchaeota archaeon]MDW8076155.1 ABC transporter permease [Nitrososphaerota archaeon]